MYVFIFLVKVTEWPPIGKIAAHSAYEMFSWYKYLIVSLVFSHLGFWSGNLFLIAPLPDLCLLVPFVDLQQKFDTVCWSIILMFFLMAPTSQSVPTSIKQFDPNRQLVRQDIQVVKHILEVNIKWSKSCRFGHPRQLQAMAIPSPLTLRTII